MGHTGRRTSQTEQARRPRGRSKSGAFKKEQMWLRGDEGGRKSKRRFWN